MSSPMDVPGRGPKVNGDSPGNGALSTSPPCESYVMDYTMSPPPNFNIHENGMLVARRDEEDMPLDLIAGEKLEESAEFHACHIFLTNYRLIVLHERACRAQSNLPPVEAIAIVNIDAVDSIGCDQLQLACKDARVVRICASSTEQALTWYKKLATLASARPASSLFALTIARELSAPLAPQPEWCREKAEPEYLFDEKAFCERLEIDPDYFSVVDYNKDFSICRSYPRSLIVPRDLGKEEIESLRDYRMLGRIPAVVWHSAEKKTMLLRASQPRCSVFSWRNGHDETFLRRVNEYTGIKRGQETLGHMKVYDCRSYTAALGNRMKGGGSEREENYSNMSIEFCNLPNIHNVRYTFTNLRNLFNPPVDQSTFLSSLQATNWLSNVMSLLFYANKAAEQLVDKGVNVLIHCSDGWDRTTQLVSLVKILVDPHYRTMKGMEEIVRRDWIGYGHKFSDRNGISGTDQNERCPVFLQWLDAVHQVYIRYSGEFEYSMAYLVKLAAHASSGLFTSFCFNSVQEMESACEAERVTPFPIWRMLNSDKAYENALFDPEQTGRIIAPDNMQAMRLWNEVYRCQEVESLLTTKHEEERNAEMRVAQTAAAAAAAGSPSSAAAGAAAAGGSSSSSDRGEQQQQQQQPTMERSLGKSRSTESIASTSESQMISYPSPPTHHRLSESVESEHEARERRNTRTSIGNGDGVSVRDRLSLSGEKEQSTSACTSPDVRAALDNDGLLRYVDQQQRTARKKLFKIEAQRSETEAAAAAAAAAATAHQQQRRGRVASELSEVSARGCDDETFQMDDLLSDASILDEHEVYNTPKNYGTEMIASKCFICRSSFSYMKPKTNCESCGRAVCLKCSAHSYKETVDGAARSKRACTECYAKMSASPMPSPPMQALPHSSANGANGSNGSSSSSNGRNCPPADPDPPAAPYRSPSQAVKG